MTEGSTPDISVVMPVYNAKAYVAEALQSVLDQTYRNFELLVIDDGSTDDSRAVIQRFHDPRVVIAENLQNVGVVATLNKLLRLSRGNFIARMDADDIAEPDRFVKQLNFLNSHPEVDIVGGAIQYFGGIKRPYTVVFPTDHEDIRVALLFYCSLAHPTLMFRRSLIDRNLLQYSDDFRHAEDYYLWTQLLQQVRSANLTDVLLRYRLHLKQVRSEHLDLQYEVAVEVRKLLLSRGGVDCTDADIELHESIVGGRFGTNTAYINQVGSWFDKIEQSNRTSGFWDPWALHRILAGKSAEVAHRLALGRSVAPLSKLTQQYLHDANYQPERTIRRLYRRAKGVARQAFSR